MKAWIETLKVFLCPIIKNYYKNDKSPVRQLAFYVDMIWGVSYDAKIIEPDEAVSMMKQHIAMMKQQYLINHQSDD